MQAGLTEAGKSRSLGGLHSWLRVWGLDREASERVRRFWLGNMVVLLKPGPGEGGLLGPAGVVPLPISP